MTVTTSPSRWIAVARLLRPQGRRGEILADPLTDLPGLLAPGREAALTTAGATSPAPGQTPLRIEAAWSPTGKNSGRIVLKLSGCDSISQAETLAGNDLLVPAADLPPLDPDTFFVADLRGCDLFDGDVRAGTIVDVQFPTSPDGRTRLEDAAPLLAVTTEPPLPTTPTRSTLRPEPQSVPETVLVPFVRAWLESVDLTGRRVVMHLPPGLFAAGGE